MRKVMERDAAEKIRAIRESAELYTSDWPHPWVPKAARA